MQTETFEVPLDGADSAEVHLDFDRGNLTVYGLASGANLFEAVVNHNERVTFRNTGASRQTIRLALNNTNAFRIGDLVSDQKVTGDVGLAAGLPLDLDIEIGSGNADLTLSALEIVSLQANSGSGTLDVVLPGGELVADLGSGSGSIKVETAEDSVLDLKANVGSGKITISVAEGTSGTLELDSGSGGITDPVESICRESLCARRVRTAWWATAVPGKPPGLPRRKPNCISALRSVPVRCGLNTRNPSIT